MKLLKSASIPALVLKSMVKEEVNYTNLSSIKVSYDS